MTTLLNGTLTCDENGNYFWSDGTPETRVHPMTASWHYNFRCRNYSDSQYIEIPLAVAQRESDLRYWFERAGQYQAGLSGDHTGPKLLVIGEKYEDGDLPGISEPGVSVTAQATRADGSKRAIPRVILVPASEWDVWSNAYPIGIRWEKADEAAILDKARSLGWKG